MGRPYGSSTARVVATLHRTARHASECPNLLEPFMPVLESLRAAVHSHVGQFTCREIGHEENTKTVSFRHTGLPPDSGVAVPDIQRLRDFYNTFAQLTLYLEEESGDAAFLIASPAQWPELDSDFRP